MCESVKIHHIIEPQYFIEYYSFLLRLWSVKDSNGVVWRTFLESAEIGEQLSFSNLNLLFEYLNQQSKSKDNVEVILINDDGLKGSF